MIQIASLIMKTGQYGNTFFLYASVIVSIILGLALNRVLVGFASMIRNRKKIQHSTILIFWMLSILLAIIQKWWAWFPAIYVEDLSFTIFLCTIVVTFSLVVCSFVIVPDLSSIPLDSKKYRNNSFNLTNYYFKNANWFSFLALITLVVSAFWNFYQGEFVEQAVIQHNFGKKLWFRIPMVGILLFTGIHGSFLRRKYDFHNNPLQIPSKSVINLHLIAAIAFFILLLAFVHLFTAEYNNISPNNLMAILDPL